MFPNYAVYNHQSAKIITLSGLLIKAATLDLAPENKTMTQTPLVLFLLLNLVTSVERGNDTISHLHNSNISLSLLYAKGSAGHLVLSILGQCSLGTILLRPSFLNM